MSSLAKEVAVVTGGAQGIGLSIVERLASDGFKTIAVDIKREELKKRQRSSAMPALM